MTADEVANSVWGHVLGTATAAERLVHLAGTTGTAAALLLMIGSGATAGEALVDYSGLPSGTAAEHLLVDSQASVVNEIEVDFEAWRKKRSPERQLQALQVALSGVAEKHLELKAERKQVAKQKRQTEFESPEYYALLLHERLVVEQLSRLNVADIERRIAALRAIIAGLMRIEADEYERQQQMAFVKQVMIEMDMAFVLMIIAEEA